VQVTISNTCPEAKFTKFKGKKLIIKDKLKFLYVKQQELNNDLYCMHFQLDNERWSRGSVLAFGTQVRGFKPGRSHRIFKGEKILSTPSFRREVKPSVPCRRFAACKRSLELHGSRILRRNLSEHFSPTKSSTFGC